jgi:uncharacterized membrane protein
MTSRPHDYTYIFLTIGFTVYGQLILKWRIAQYGQLPNPLSEKILFLFRLLLDPIILSGFVAAFLAALAWMAAMTKFEVSHAYPFMSLSFAAVLLFSALLLQESITLPKIIGVALIIAGTLVVSYG